MTPYAESFILGVANIRNTSKKRRVNYLKFRNPFQNLTNHILFYTKKQSR